MLSHIVNFRALRHLISTSDWNFWDRLWITDSCLNGGQSIVKMSLFGLDKAQ